MRILVVRLAAIGDAIIITPLLRHLHNKGNEIVLLTSTTGMEVLKYNPHIELMIEHKRNSVTGDKLTSYFKDVAKENNCEKVIDLCESIECNLCFHPVQPEYNRSKQERTELANKNYYEETFVKAGVKPDSDETFIPELFFTDEEEEENARFRAEFVGKKIITWALAGSSLHKCYAHMQAIMSYILLKYPDIVFVTVGDAKCLIIEEGLKHERVIRKSDRWTIRQSLCMVKNSFAVIAPDTGILHASGCFKVPKMGLLTATSKENISKHFYNDYSLESKIPCSPCFRLIYDASVQCPLDPGTNLPFCSVFGIEPDLVIKQLEQLFTNHGRAKNVA